MPELKEASPDTKTVREFHRNSDVDGGPKSHHHTLGPGPNQAAPGNHTHDGGNSATLDADRLPYPVTGNIGQANPPGTVYAAVGNVDFTCDEDMLVEVNLSGVVRAQGTGTNDITVKVVASGATTHDSGSDVPGYSGRLYQWASGTTAAYGKQEATYKMSVTKGTTTFTVQAVRTTAGTTSLAGALVLQITPLGLAKNYA